MGLLILKDLFELSIVFDGTKPLERDTMNTKSVFLGPGEKRCVLGAMMTTRWPLFFIHTDSL